MKAAIYAEMSKLTNVKLEGEYYLWIKNVWCNWLKIRV